MLGQLLPFPKHRFYFAWVVPLSLLFVHPSHANSEASLLGTSDRPSIATIETLLPFDPKAIELPAGITPVEPNRASANHMPNGWVKLAVSEGPRLIAVLEATFPGGKYVFLGRDSQLLADMVEAFYRSIGQTDRVVRIGVSKASFKKASSATLLKLLESHGFDFNAIKKQPYVFVDTISGGDKKANGGGRQGKTLLQVIYNEYARRGGNPADLPRRVTMLGLLTRTSNLNENPAERAEGVFSRQEALLSQGLPADFLHQIELPTFRDKGTFFTESGYQHHTGAWHDSYGPISTNRSTKHTSAKQGPPLDLAQQRMILYTQKLLVSQVQTRSFYEKVQAELKSLGAPELKDVFTQVSPAMSKQIEMLQLVEETIEATLYLDAAAKKGAVANSAPQIPPRTKAEQVDSILKNWIIAASFEQHPAQAAVLMTKSLKALLDKKNITQKTFVTAMDLVLRQTSPSLQLLETIEKAGVKKLLKDLSRESTQKLDLISRLQKSPEEIWKDVSVSPNARRLEKSFKHLARRKTSRR